MPAALSAAPAVQAVDLRCEYRRDPQGIDVAAPRLSWRMESPDPAASNIKQTAYRLVVATSQEKLASDSGDLWDSGRISSSDSIQIPYGGKALSSGRAAFWKVQIWDGANQSSGWSQTGKWSTGLVRPADWTASWIGFDNTDSNTQLEERPLPARMLRKEFVAARTIRRATVYLSGLGLSELYIDGHKISSDVLSPGITDYDKRVFYVTYDVTRNLTAGRNAIGILLGNGRYWAPRVKVPIPSRTFGTPRARLQLEIEYSDGSTARVITDPTWKATADGPIRANNEYDGEVYDARREMQGWTEPKFDDSGWHGAQVVAGPKGTLAAQMAEPIQIVQSIKPIKMTNRGSGKFIFDMGQNMVGWCRLHVQGPRGTQITLRHAETLKADGSLYVANLRSAKALDTYTLKGGGAEDWHPRFTYHGFRFVEVTGYPGTPDLSSIQGQVVHDSLDQTSNFVSSDAMLNSIHQNIFWGIRGNYRSIPTDCPQRDERQGWLGDRSVVSRSETYFFNVAAFYSKWSDDLADSQHPNGSVPDVSPNFWQIYNDDVTWPSTFVQVPAMLYDQYADKRVIARHYEAMGLWVAHTKTYMKDGLLPKDTFGDWCVPPEDPKLIHSQDPARKTDGTLLATAYFYWINTRMARFAALLGKEPDAAEYSRTAAELKAAFNKAYFHADSGWYANNTQTANILPLAFGMVPAGAHSKVVSALAENIRNKSNRHVATGLVGVQWLMRTLTGNGQVDLAFEIATQPTYPGWGYMVSKGATTIWELWNGDTADPAMNSGNHVMQMGDLGLWMYEDLAGIRPDPDHPGFKHTIIHPTLVNRLHFVRASHDSLYGKISSEWKRNGDHVNLSVSIPPNTTATVYVPGGSKVEIGSGTSHFQGSIGPN